MNRKTLDGIGYDRALDNAANRATLSNQLWAEYEMLSGRKLSFRTIQTPAGEQLDVSHITGTPEQTDDVNLARSVALDTAMSRKELELILGAHQFVLGESTVDALFNTRAKDFSYVDAGKVPFDNFFASFIDPLTVTLPFTNTPVTFDGIHIMRTDSHYRVSGHFLTQDQRKDYFAAHLRLINPREPRIGGRITNIGVHPAEKDDFDALYTKGFIYNASSDELIVIPPTHDIIEDFNDKPFRFMNHPAPLKIMPEAYLGNPEEKGFKTISNMTNLAVNIINYINSHNLHIVNRNRTVHVSETPDKGKRKVKAHTLPYSIVVVRDGELIVEEERENRENVRDYRSYVRGHDRRYPGEERRYWVNSYIRGPEGAPFRDQKHVVLAEKLLREREWMRKQLSSQ